jgi:ribosomal protein L37AE/L43A
MVLRCPVCKSKNITTYMGGQFGKWQCKKCGYIGALIIEESDYKAKKTKKKPSKL